MEITVKKQVDEVVELDVPAYFKMSSYCPCYYKVTEDGVCFCITVYPDGRFNLTFETSLNNVITYEDSTAEEFYQVVKDLTFYVQTI